MGDPTAEYWVRLLQKSGHAGTADEHLRAALFLIHNDFDTRSSLVRADSPRHWLGAEEFASEELECLSKVCK